MAKTLGSAQQGALIDFLVERRRAAGMTQADLAARLGQYQSYVARLESGQRRIDVVELVRLAEILAFDPAEALAIVRTASE